jgi:radical SAM superfamily enzyme YgiQ (UPF0313 family)
MRVDHMETSDNTGTPARHTILLIQAVDYDSRMLTGFEPQCAPVSVATVAALTPDTFEVDIWDENLDGPIDATTVLPRPSYDIVGISTLFERVGRRVPKLAAIFRNRGAYICAGGPGISNHIKTINTCVDSIFLNEAEHTWPQFLHDWTRGQPRREYIQVAKPDLALSPPPAWRTLERRIPAYRAGSVQTTRGCPFDCEFCDVIYLYGRAQRHKPVEHVLTEVRNLEKLGARRIMFTDDEFVGDPRYAKALLTELIPTNNSFAQPLSYHTQFTLTLSHRDELLELIADANFWYGVVGIESFNEASLLETNKTQNIHGDIVTNCRKILSRGIGINGSLIVGFDNDGPDIFDRILEGVRNACIPMASASILRAIYGTKLWTRMRESRRLWKLPDRDSFAEALQVDILPAGALSRADLIEGRIYLNNSFANVENLCGRLRGWVDLIERVPRLVAPVTQLDDAIALIRGYEAARFTPKELHLIEDTLAYTSSAQPWMLGRVADSVLNQLRWHRLRTFHNTEQLEVVLAAERAGNLVPDTTPILLPSAFSAAFRKSLLRLVYERLYRSLSGPDLIAEAASEVFVDFLVRLGEESASMTAADFGKPHHVAFLRQLCDRTAARLSGQSPEDFVPVEEPDGAPLKGLKKSGLYDAVLKEIGDRLRVLNAPTEDLQVAKVP